MLGYSFNIKFESQILFFVQLSEIFNDSIFRFTNISFNFIK